MPPRSSIYALPKEIRETLEERLDETGYGSLDSHVEWLARQGYAISRSAISRYSPLARSVNAVRERFRAAAATTDAVIEEASLEISPASRRLMSEAILRRAIADELSLDDLMSLSEAAARLSSEDAKERQIEIAAERLGLQRDKLALEQRRQQAADEERALRARELEASIARMGEKAASHNAGVSPEAIAALRAAILEGM